MSTKYSGGIITKSPVTPAGPYETGAAPGVWTVEQALQYTKQGIWPTQGNVPNYIEDVFSTWLYTGNGGGSATGYYGTQTITNGINLSANGGLVWVKARANGPSAGAEFHRLADTSRGVNKLLSSNSTSAEQTGPNTITAFNTTGFNLGSDSDSYGTNVYATTYASWTFREQPKFFDVATYTGTGATQTITHNLGSVPGCIIIKKVDSTTFNAGWYVYHRSLTDPNTYYLRLETTQAQTNFGDNFISNVTSTTFTVNGTSGGLGLSGSTYVAYVFAHNAGGFGLTGTDNVISCGSFTTDSGGNATVTLGYEPAWLMFKCSSNAGQNWEMIDTMRGWSMSTDVSLQANSAAAEASGGYGNPTSTGFVMGGQGNTQTYIYIAIRRGPMKVPTSGTSVFSPNTANASAGTPIVTNFPVDLSISVANELGDTRFFSDRLRGVNSTGQTANQPWVASNSSGAELTNASIPRGWDNTQILLPPYYAGGPTVWWNFRRAPSFFDEVCYTGTGVAGRTVTHNLTVAPELMIVKGRSNAGQWRVYSSALGATQAARLNSTDSFGSNPYAWNNTAPTASVFTVGDDTGVNENTYTYVTYLFATCAGVSKVGSYTGNGSTQTIDCGFTGGARFVLIKRTDAASDWYTYDTARGMTVLTDPYLLLNSTAAETATLGSVTTVSTGFALNSSILAAINASGGTYIFLAIA